MESAAIPGADREIASPEQLKADKKIVEDEIAFWRDLCDAPTSYQRQVNVSYKQLFIQCNYFSGIQLGF